MYGGACPPPKTGGGVIGWGTYAKDSPNRGFMSQSSTCGIFNLFSQMSAPVATAFGPDPAAGSGMFKNYYMSTRPSCFEELHEDESNDVHGIGIRTAAGRICSAPGTSDIWATCPARVRPAPVCATAPTRISSGLSAATELPSAVSADEALEGHPSAIADHPGSDDSAGGGPGDALVHR